MRSLYFVVLAVLLLGALVALLLSTWLRGRRSAETTWEDLLKQLTQVDRDAIATIALDVVSESGEPRPESEGFMLDPSAVWKLLGGLAGMEVLEHNCHVLVDLASYVQKWYPEALVVSEQLRLSAREIEWHVGRLKGAAETGNLQSSFADYAQRAVVTYYLMTRNVLALYGHANFARLAELQQAI